MAIFGYVSLLLMGSLNKSLKIGMLYDIEHLSGNIGTGSASSLLLSFSQQWLWFIDKSGGGSPEYKIPIAFPISGVFDITSVEETFNHIIQKYQQLRCFLQKRSGLKYSKNISTKFDLSIDVDITESGGFVSWTYDATLLSREHIEVINLQIQNLRLVLQKAQRKN